MAVAGKFRSPFLFNLYLFYNLVIVDASEDLTLNNCIYFNNIFYSTKIRSINFSTQLIYLWESQCLKGVWQSPIKTVMAFKSFYQCYYVYSLSNILLDLVLQEKIFFSIKKKKQNSNTSNVLISLHLRMCL